MEPRFPGEGVVPGEYFLVSTKLDTFCYLTMQSAVVLTQYRRVTDGQTDGIAVASTALAKQSAVKSDKNHQFNNYKSSVPGKNKQNL